MGLHVSEVSYSHGTTLVICAKSISCQGPWLLMCRPTTVDKKLTVFQIVLKTPWSVQGMETCYSLLSSWGDEVLYLNLFSKRSVVRSFSFAVIFESFSALHIFFFPTCVCKTSQSLPLLVYILLIVGCTLLKIPESKFVFHIVSSLCFQK